MDGRRETGGIWFELPIIILNEAVQKVLRQLALANFILNGHGFISFCFVKWDKTVSIQNFIGVV